MANIIVMAFMVIFFFASQPIRAVCLSRQHHCSPGNCSPATITIMKILPLTEHLLGPRYNSWCFIYPPVSITTNVEKLRDGDLKWLRQKQHTWEIENSSPTLSLSPSPSVCVSLCVCVHKAEAYMFGHVPSKSQENLNCRSSGVDVSFSSPPPFLSLSLSPSLLERVSH